MCFLMTRKSGQNKTVSTFSWPLRRTENTNCDEMGDHRVNTSMTSKRIVLTKSAMIAACLLMLPGIVCAGIYNLYHFAKDQDWVAPGLTDLGFIGDLPQYDATDFSSLIGPMILQDQTLEAEYLILYEALHEMTEADRLQSFAQRMQQVRGKTSIEYAAALTLEAQWHLHQQLAEPAIRNLEKAISIVERLEGKFSAQLIQLQTLLGVARSRSGDYRKSQYHLGQAMSLLHRKDGTLTGKQMPVLYLRAKNLLMMDEAWSSEQLLRTALRVSRHNTGVNDVETIDPAITLFRHLREENEYHDALHLFNDMRERFANEDGSDSPAFAPMMMEASLMHLLQNNAEVDRGLRLQRDLVTLMHQFPESFSRTERVNMLLRLADWLIMFDLEDEAAGFYKQAWQVSRETEDVAYWDTLFSEPRLINAGPNPTLSTFGYHWANRLAWTRFNYHLGADGRPSQLEIVESNLHRSTTGRTLQLFRMARFRPVLVDGVPQDSQVHEYLRVYNTEPEEEDSRLRQPPPQRKTKGNRMPHRNWVNR